MRWVWPHAHPQVQRGPRSIGHRKGENRLYDSIVAQLLTIRWRPLPFAMAKFGEHKVMEQTDGYTEITGKNFQGWPTELIEESKRANANGRVGTKLLLESHLARIWVIELKPGERLPFHRHVLKYFWTVPTEGAGLSHTPDGLTRQIKYRVGDTKHLEYRKDEGMTHDLQNVGTGDLVFITVEFVQSENKPLSLEQGAP
jgi:beta-alanine degradation protein BauB